MESGSEEVDSCDISFVFWGDTGRQGCIRIRETRSMGEGKKTYGIHSLLLYFPIERRKTTWLVPPARLSP